MKWSLKLQDYDFDIKYRPGHANIADPFSRLSSTATASPSPDTYTVSEQLITQILDAHTSCGHGGLAATFHLLDPTNSDPSLRKAVAQILRSCSVSSAHNQNQFRQKPIAIFSAGPFHRILIDTVGPLMPSVSGKSYIFVAIDHFTRWIEALSVDDKFSKTMAEFIISSIILRHGAPSIIQTDSGTEFDNQLVKNICTTLETDISGSGRSTTEAINY